MGASIFSVQGREAKASGRVLMTKKPPRQLRASPLRGFSSGATHVQNSGTKSVKNAPRLGMTRIGRPTLPQVHDAA